MVISWLSTEPDQENQRKILAWLKESEPEGLEWGQSREQPPNYPKAKLYTDVEFRIARGFSWENDLFKFTSGGVLVPPLQITQLKLYELENILHVLCTSEPIYPYVFRRY